MRALLVIAALSAPAFADDVLHPGTPQLDPPTITALGVALPITGSSCIRSAAHRPSARSSITRP